MSSAEAQTRNDTIIECFNGSYLRTLQLKVHRGGELLRLDRLDSFAFSRYQGLVAGGLIWCCLKTAVVLAPL